MGCSEHLWTSAVTLACRCGLVFCAVSFNGITVGLLDSLFHLKTTFVAVLLIAVFFTTISMLFAPQLSLLREGAGPFALEVLGEVCSWAWIAVVTQIIFEDGGSTNQKLVACLSVIGGLVLIIPSFLLGMRWLRHHRRKRQLQVAEERGEDSHTTAMQYRHTCHHLQEVELSITAYVLGFSLAACVGLLVEKNTGGDASSLDHVLVYFLELTMAIRVILFVEDQIKNLNDNARKRKGLHQQRQRPQAGGGQEEAACREVLPSDDCPGQDTTATITTTTTKPSPSATRIGARASVLTGALELAEATVAVVVGFSWLTLHRASFEQLVYSNWATTGKAERPEEQDDAVWIEGEGGGDGGGDEALSGAQVGFACLWFALMCVTTVAVYALTTHRLKKAASSEGVGVEDCCRWWESSWVNPLYWVRRVLYAVAVELCTCCGYCSLGGGGEARAEEEEGEGAVADNTRADNYDDMRRQKKMQKKREALKRGELILSALSLSLGVAAEMVLGDALHAGLGGEALTLLLQAAVVLLTGGALAVHHARAQAEAHKKREAQRRKRRVSLQVQQQQQQLGLSEALLADADRDGECSTGGDDCDNNDDDFSVFWFMEDDKDFQSDDEDQVACP